MLIYPGIEERMRENAKFWESLMDQQIEALEPDKRAKVSEACASCGLDSEGTRYVLAITCDLIEFERSGRDKVLTDSQKVEIIEYIRDASLNLSIAIRDLPALREGTELRRKFYTVSKEFGELERLRLGSSRAPDELTFAVLAKAADQMLTARVGLAGKGGRRGLRTHYSEKCISPIADVFDRCGRSVGRGGAFERLCTIVFEVAGVRAVSEGAVRYYLTERKKRGENMPENSSEKASE